MDAALAELNRIRLDDDLSYAALADQIEQITSKRIDRSALFRALQNERRPRDRTMAKIHKFLEHRRRTRRGAGK